MRIHVLTLFPGLFDGFLDETIVRIAQEKGALEVDLVDFREFATDRHRKVDDRPFGGGPGMLLMPDPIVRAVEAIERIRAPVDSVTDQRVQGMSRGITQGTPRTALHRVMLTPTGTPLTQETVERLAKLQELVLLCGRYEGFDERVRQVLDWEEISIGDYVLSGGEVPAMVVIDAIARLLPGVLGDDESVVRESFRGGLLDYPQYTRPREYRGLEVPEVLLSGDHAKIEAWREQQARERTQRRAARIAADAARKPRTDAAAIPEPRRRTEDP